MAFLVVQVRPGPVVPLMRHPRRVIGLEPIRVEDSLYYRRRLAENDWLPAASGNFSPTHQS